jgi:hypothetical protein
VPGGLPIWALSGDGSTLVAFDHRFQLDPARVTAVVRELPGGPSGRASRSTNRSASPTSAATGGGWS